MIRAILIAALLLSGCAISPSIAPIRCPTLKNYTALEQNTLADEMLKDGFETQLQIEDYLKLRQACVRQRGK